MSKKTFLFLIAASVLSLAGLCVLYPQLPDVVPVHWNFAGEVDGYAGKISTLLLGGIPLLMSILFWFVPKIDPRKASYRKHEKAYGVFMSVTVLLMIAFSWVTAFAALGKPVDISTIVPVGIGILLLVLGNYTPQIRPNYTFGIKTPWAIENEYVWKKTHTMGGIVYCILGVLMILAGFLKFQAAAVVALAAVIAGTVFLYVYSWLVFRRVTKGIDGSSSKRL